MHMQFLKTCDTSTRTNTVYWAQSQARWTLDTHMNRQLHTTIPGLTREFHQQLMRAGTRVLTKAESATQDKFLAGCPEVEWWTSCTELASSQVKKNLTKIIKSLDCIVRPALSNTFVLNVFFFYGLFFFFFPIEKPFGLPDSFFICHRKTDCWWQTQVRLVKVIPSSLPKIVAPGIVLVSWWKSKDLKSEFRSAFVLNYKMVHCSLNE